MVGRFLYWVVFALLLRFVWRSLFARMTPPLPTGSAPRGEGEAAVYKGIMVRDPVCGLHLPESRALVEIRSGERVHFCSEDCRASFRTQRGPEGPILPESRQPERSAKREATSRGGGAPRH